jgi:hypothetical protein
MKQALSFLILILSSTYSLGQTLFLSNPVEVVTNVTYGGIRPKIALNQAGEPVVAIGKGGSNSAIFVSRMSGGQFQTPIQLNHPSSLPIITTVTSAEIKAHGDTIYVVYAQTDATTAISIVLWRSTDGGQSFPDSSVVFSSVNEHSDFPELVIKPNGNPVVAFIKYDLNMITTQMMVAVSTDFGASFQTPVEISSALSGQPCECCPIAMETLGNDVYIAYRNNIANEREFYLFKSQDGGLSFPDFWQMENSNYTVAGCPDNGIDLLAGSDTLFSAFATIFSGSMRIYHNGFNPTTESFSTTIQADPSGNTIAMQQAEIEGVNDTLFVCWQDNSNSSTDCYLSYRLGNSSTFSQAVRFNDLSNGTQRSPDLFWKNGYLHLVWTDQTNGKVFYRKASFSAFTGTHEAPSVKQVLISPNPASKTLKIQSKELIINALIYEISGKQCRFQESIYSQEINIDLEDLKPGTYWVEIQLSNGKSEIHQFIKT